ncbi:hypothetical protein [Nonomuraea sp. NPDC005692]|uniref:hypothetical protein n=1 Tax=Nonomuraea sp. NPDC005692 TaxID=3157168 RepID=UPI0033FEB153
MSHFYHLTSYEGFLATFGRPDRARKDEAYGDLMRFDNYYWGAHKYVRWDAWEHRMSLINFEVPPRETQARDRARRPSAA